MTTPESLVAEALEAHHYAGLDSKTWGSYSMAVVSALRDAGWLRGEQVGELCKYDGALLQHGSWGDCPAGSHRPVYLAAEKETNQ